MPSQPPAGQRSGGLKWLAFGGAALLGLGVVSVAVGALAWTASSSEALDPLRSGAGGARHVLSERADAVGACRVAGSEVKLVENVDPGLATHLNSRQADSVELDTALADKDERQRFIVDLSALSTRRAAATDRPTQPFELTEHEGIVYRYERGAYSQLWNTRQANTSEPQLATVGDAHAVVTRTGKQQGAIQIGWLDSDGKPTTSLWRVVVNATRVGKPSVAAGSGEALVAFSAMQNDNWQLAIARAPRGSAPERARVLDIDAAEGENAIAPTLARRGDGSWLLQWTQGSAGHRRVRVLRLSSSLEPLGRPLDVSRADANSGQGTVWAEHGKALSVYLVERSKRYELWGTTLACPTPR